MKISWKPDIAPVKITDDIAFVGGTPVSVHCFEAEGGLILLDTGYPGMLEGIRENMAALSYRLEDVRWLVHTHGHIDHYGCTAEIVRLTGAETYLGREDVKIVTGEEDLSWAKELNLSPAESFVPDVLFSDGDVLELGGRRIRCVHAPGHTQGTYAFFIDSRAGGEPVVAAMHGGVGVNSMAKAFLEGYGLPLSIREEFRRGLHALAAERVDVVLGIHPNQNDTEGKIARRDGNGNPFVDSGEWQRFLIENEGHLDNMLKREEKQV